MTKEQKIIELIKDVVDKEYKNDVDLVVVYGSYVTKKMNSLSDLDMFFVPRTDDAYKMMKTFIYEDIGYDLWPIQWERLEGFSNFMEPFVSILADSEIIYFRDEEAKQRFDDLKENMIQQMSKEDNGHLMWRIGFEFTKLESILYKLNKSNELADARNCALTALESMLLIIAYLNQTYIKKGPERLEDEFQSYDYYPEGFKESFTNVLNVENIEVLKHNLNDFYNQIQREYKRRMNSEVNYSDTLIGTYEELKSTYNKVYAGLDEENWIKVAYALKSIDTETSYFFGSENEFPLLLNSINKKDQITSKVREHEDLWLKKLIQYGVEVNQIETLDELKLLLSKD